MTRIAFLGASILWLASTATFAADVAVSVQVGQPGFYGQIDIGRFPQPQVIYPQAIIIQQPPTVIVQSPIYLRVLPGHQKNWRKHCRRYQACGQPVYFVQDQWYQTNVVTRADRRGGYDDEREYKKGKDKHGDKHKNKSKDEGNRNGKGHGRHQNEQ
jgi:hypothetical protein